MKTGVNAVKSLINKALAVVLTLCVLVSALAGSTFAASAGTKRVPVIEVIGFGESLYKGLSTPNEDDDVQIWPPTGDSIIAALKNYLPGLLVNLLLGRYQSVAEYVCGSMQTVFDGIACDENGIPDPDTGIKGVCTPAVEKDKNGYADSYTFRYDWRCDMHTIAAQLDIYINEVMQATGSDKVALVAMSMGNCVLTTYLYEYYYTAEDYASRDHIAGVVFLAGAMNGVETCGDPFSGNFSFDSTSFMRFFSELWRESESMKPVYYLLEGLYVTGALECVTDYVSFLSEKLIDGIIDEGMLKTIGTIPGYYAMMSAKQYADAEKLMFATAEKQSKYSSMIAKNRYYHDYPQKYNKDVIESLLSDGINTGIFAQYGYTLTPVTSDNDRLSDGTIATMSESFGATCSEVDGTLGDGYVQARACACGKNHVSPDRQIDASTCAFPDITWFGRNMRHTDSSGLLGDIIDSILYAPSQMTVFSNHDYPQYLLDGGNGKLVALTAENAGSICAYEKTTLWGSFVEKVHLFFAK